MILEIAKKIAKPVQGAAGLSLRSINYGEDKTLAIVVADSYDNIKASAEAFRMMTGKEILSRSRGKSLEIETAHLETMVEFLSSFSFNNEDVTDTLEFLTKHADLYLSELKSLDLEVGKFSLVVDAADPDAFQSKIMPVLDEYSMGLILS